MYLLNDGYFMSVGLQWTNRKIGKIVTLYSVKDDGEANSCSVGHNPTLLGPQQFITFSQESVTLVI